VTLWIEAQLFVQAHRCDGLRYYHAVRGNGRLAQASGLARNAHVSQYG
jgi:hypothetical protein